MVEIKFTVTEKDLRSAMYYPYLVKHRRTLYMFILSTAGSLICFLLARFGVIPDLFLLYFISIAYFFFLAVVFGRLEQAMRKYLRSTGCIIGREFICNISKEYVRIRMEKEKIDNNFILSKLAGVVDMKDVFLFHLTGDQVNIVPKRAFTPEQLETALAVLKEVLQERVTVFRLFPKK